jgi:hypothetical protein
VGIFTRASAKRTVSDKSPTRARELPDSAFYEQTKKASGGEANDRTEEFPYDLHPRVSDRETARFANVFTRARGALLISAQGVKQGVKSQGRVAQTALSRKKIVPKLAMMW